MAVGQKYRVPQKNLLAKGQTYPFACGFSRLAFFWPTIKWVAFSKKTSNVATFLHRVPGIRKEITLCSSGQHFLTGQSAGCESRCPSDVIGASRCDVWKAKMISRNLESSSLMLLVVFCWGFCVWMASQIWRNEWDKNKKNPDPGHWQVYKGFSYHLYTLFFCLMRSVVNQKKRNHHLNRFKSFRIFWVWRDAKNQTNAGLNVALPMTWLWFLSLLKDLEKRFSFFSFLLPKQILEHNNQELLRRNPTHDGTMGDNCLASGIECEEKETCASLSFCRNLTDWLLCFLLAITSWDAQTRLRFFFFVIKKLQHELTQLDMKTFVGFNLPEEISDHKKNAQHSITYPCPAGQTSSFVLFPGVLKLEQRQRTISEPLKQDSKPPLNDSKRVVVPCRMITLDVYTYRQRPSRKQYQQHNT